MSMFPEAEVWCGSCESNVMDASIGASLLSRMTITESGAEAMYSALKSFPSFLYVTSAWASEMSRIRRYSVISPSG